jgi:predicted PurR-regulated permease PerM
MQPSYAETLKRSLIFVAVALLPVLIWYLFDVILIAFGAIIVAMLLWLGAEPFMRWLSLRPGIALALSGLLILMIVGTIVVLFGTRVAIELQDVFQRTASGAAGVEQTLRQSEWGGLALNHIAGSSFSLTGLLGSFLRVSSSVLEGVVIAVISGIYLAAQPRLYLDGLIQLLPPEAHARAGERIGAIGNALRLWLVGQLIQMVIIGALAMVALLLIGVPSALALGLIAALGEFVPYVGPIVAAIPALLVAMTVGPTAALWTVGAYVAINQIEGHLLIPLIQRHLVFIPPAVILLGIVAVTDLFGQASFIFAAPLSVVIFIAVKVIYVRDTLGEETRIPGESS